ncbi:hypothetical protein D3C76_1642450 [compost metagenome]
MAGSNDGALIFPSDPRCLLRPQGELFFTEHSHSYRMGDEIQSSSMPFQPVQPL